MPSVTFGPFEFDPNTGELRRSGVAVNLQRQPSRLLALLVERAGELVTREEIRQVLWEADTFVDFDQSVNFCIRQIRAALHDNASTPCYLETLPRRGYRFIAPVELSSAHDDPRELPPPPTHSPLRIPSWHRLVVVSIALLIAGAASGNAYRHGRMSAAAVAPSGSREVQLGLYFLNKMTNADTLIAIEHFEAAARTDPPNPAALAGLADAYMQLGGVFVSVKPPVNVRFLARRAATRAIELAPNLAEAHAALGGALLPELRWQQAAASLRHAIELKPEYSRAHLTYATYLVGQHRFAEAIDEARKGWELDPTSVRARHVYAWMLYFDRQYDAAIRELRAVLQMDHGFAWAQWRLGQVLLVAGRCDEAVRALRTAVEMTDRAPATLGLLAMAEACNGDRPHAVQILEEMENRSVTQNVAPGAMLLGYLAVNDRSKAMDILDHIYADRDGYGIYVSADPLMDPLRSEPRFQAICQKLMADTPASALEP